VKKLLHKFIIGPQRIGLLEIWQDFGCFVDVPKFDNPSEFVTLRGPENTLLKALQVVMDRYQSMSIEEIELTSDQRRYMLLKERPSIRAIEEEFKINSFVKPNSLEIQGKKENIENAWKQIKALENKVKNLHYTNLDLDRSFHKYIVGKKGHTVQKLKNDYKVDIVVPFDSEEYHTILIVSDSEETNSMVHDKINELVQKHLNLTTGIMKVEKKFLNAIIGFKGIQLKQFQEAVPDVAIQIHDEDKGMAGVAEIELKGTLESIELMKSAINEFIEENRHEITLNSHVVEKIVKKELIPFITKQFKIKVKNEYNVKVDVDSEIGKVTLKGQKQNVELVAKVLVEKLTEIQNTISESFSVEQKYHRTLIGSNGGNVKKLREKYSVQIFFGSNDSQDNIDRITIKGLNTNVAKCKKELLDLLAYEIEKSCTEVIEAAKSSIPFLVGKGGSNIETIKYELDVSIELPPKNSSHEEKGKFYLFW
jgi:hypothetical protein